MRELVPVAVAVSTLGRPDALARCLASLAAGTALPAEVAVVDQSPDGSARAVCDDAELEVRYARQDAAGLARGQNAAVRLTDAAVFAVLDDDCVAGASWLEAIARSFERERELAGLAGRVLPLGPDVPGLHAVSLRTSRVRRDFAGEAPPWEVGSGNNFALRREWFERVGGCDERLGPGSRARGGVDMDLFRRLLRAGARLRYEPDAVVYHERKPLRGRFERRVSYGHGMGAACAVWLRSGDRGALRVLRGWIALRLGLLVAGIRQRRWRALPEEALVLASTAVGFVRGLRLRGAR